MHPVELCLRYSGEVRLSHENHGLVLRYMQLQPLSPRLDIQWGPTSKGDRNTPGLAQYTRPKMRLNLSEPDSRLAFPSFRIATAVVEV